MDGLTSKAMHAAAIAHREGKEFITAVPEKIKQQYGSKMS